MDPASWAKLCFETKEAMTAHVAPFVTPISESDQPDYGWASGTGNYVELSRTYLLTNSHVAVVAPPVVIAHLPSPGDHFVRLAGTVFDSPRPVDIALAPVPTLPARGDRASLTRAHFDTQFAPVKDELFFWFGYPGTTGVRNDPKMRDRRLYSWFGELTVPGVPMLTQRFQEWPTGLDPDVTPADHVVLHYPEMAQATPNGPLVDLRNPEGFSGSLLWDTKRVACALSGAKWDPSLSRVCGIIWGSAVEPASIIATQVQHLHGAFSGL